MKENFENQIKNTVEQFDQSPSGEVWSRLSAKMKNQSVEPSQGVSTWKILTGAAIGILAVAGIIWSLNSSDVPATDTAPEEQAAIAQQVTMGKGKLATELFPTELEMAQREGKGLMVYVCMENCVFCAKFVRETLSLPHVHEYLEEHFQQVAVDLRDDDYRPFLEQHEINAAPSTLFFSPDGKFITSSKGACPAEEFESVIEEVTQHIQKAGVKIEPQLTVFPNPSDGRFTLRADAAPGPVYLSILDESGRQVFQKNIADFSGYHEEEIDLTAFPKGMFLLHFQQEGTKMTEKVLVR